jgi:N utilization substance protein A
MNARLAARLTGWKIDIQSDTEFAQAEAEIAFGGPDGAGEDISGRCSAILSTGKRCPNAALPGTRYCGVPAHQALADDPTAAERGAAVPLSDGSAAASGDDETETEGAGGVATEVAVADAPFEAIDGALADVELAAEAAESAEASPGDGAEEARGDA